jgi:hypothetical protein
MLQPTKESMGLKQIQPIIPKPLAVANKRFQYAVPTNLL